MLGGYSDAILIINIVMLALSLPAVILRCYVRLRIIKVFGWDDGLMILAMVSSPADKQSMTLFKLQ
jgi:hypothetical protein